MASLRDAEFRMGFLMRGATSEGICNYNDIDDPLLGNWVNHLSLDQWIKLQIKW